MNCRICSREVTFIKVGTSPVRAIHKGDTMPEGAAPVKALAAPSTERKARRVLEAGCEGKGE